MCYSVNLPPKITRFSLSFGSWASVCSQCAAKNGMTNAIKMQQILTYVNFSNTSHEMWFIRCLLIRVCQFHLTPCQIALKISRVFHFISFHCIWSSGVYEPMSHLGFVALNFIRGIPQGSVPGRELFFRNRSHQT